MTLFLQQVVEGLGSGAIYATLALALVLIFRATGVINFGQGEMATLSAFLCWQLTAWGVSLGFAIAIAVAFSFLLGAAVERTIVRPVEQGDPLTLLVVTLGLFFVFNSIMRFFWGTTPHHLASIVPNTALNVAGVHLATQSLTTLGIVLAVALALYVLFSRTLLGIVLRAAATNPGESRLLGVNVNRMLMIGWGLAAAVGGLGGVLVAPGLGLQPTMMQVIIIFAFAGAALGGFDSPLGAVVGGLIVGVSQNLAATYIDAIGNELSVVVPFALIVAVLLVRPSGLFGTAAAGGRV